MPAISSSLQANVNATIQGVTTPLNATLTLTTANTEYSHAFAANTKRFLIHNRSAGLIKLAYTSTESGSNFLSIYPGTMYTEGQISAGSLTIYMQSPTASKVVEIVSWV